MRGWTASALFTLAAGAATFGIYAVARWPFGWVQVAMLVFLGLLTALLLGWQEQAMQADPRGFMRRFMIGLAVKLGVALLAVALVLFLSPREQAPLLALTFTVLYLAFLAFTTARLGRSSRRLPRP
ncbi:MAG: hypothetical protein J5I62_03605 [Flavobacteriales bacterium]|nr:hypothetical protein [Flavobacteriales bacterium]MEB2340948.1 hypothetical protein [Flavobacteriia bacterium]